MANTTTELYLIKIAIDSTQVPKLKAALQQVQAATGSTVKSMQAMGEKSNFADINLGKLVARALITIPVWWALRNSMMAVFTTVGDGIQRIIDLDAALAKMAALTTDYSVSMREDMRKGVEDIVHMTGRSVNEVSDAYVKIAESGKTFEESMAGARVAMQLSVATFSNSGETARMLIDLYDMFGKTITEATTPMEKMQYIAGFFIPLWKQQKGTLNEYIDALRAASGVASSWGLNMKQTLFLVTSLNTAMQRGSIGGTQLARALQDMTKNRTEVEKFLGTAAYSQTRGNFFEQYLAVMEKVRNMQKAGVNAEDIGIQVQNIFGERSQKGILGMAANMEHLMKVWNDVKNLPLPEAIKLLNQEFERQSNTIKVQIDRFKELTKTASSAFLEGISGSKDMLSMLTRINDALEKSIPLWRTLGVVIKSIAEALMVTGLLKLAGGLGGAIGKTTQLGKDWAAARTIKGTPWGVVGANAAQTLPPLALASLAPALQSLIFFTRGIGVKMAAFMSGGMASALLGIWPTLALILATTAINMWKAAQDAEEQRKKEELRKQGYEAAKAEEAGRKGAVDQAIKDATKKTEDSRKMPWQKESPNAKFPWVKQQITGEQAKVREAIMEGVDKAKAEADAKAKEASDQAAVEVESRKVTELEKQLIGVERLKALGYSNLEIEKAKLAILDQAAGKQKEAAEQEKKVIQMMIEEVNQLAEVFQNAFARGIEGLIKNESSFKGFITSLGDTMRDTMTKQVSEGLASSFMKVTGFGEIFGIAGVQMKELFGGLGGKIEASHIKGIRSGALMIYQAHIKGMEDGAKIIKGVAVTGGGGTSSIEGIFSESASMAGAPVGFGGAFGNFGGSGLANWMRTPMGGQRVIVPPSNQLKVSGVGGSFAKAPSRQSNIQAGGVTPGAVLAGGMYGYSAYQSAKAGGVGTAQAVGSGLMGAAAMVGAAGLLGSAGTAFGVASLAGPVGWAVVGALMVGSLLLGTMGKKSSQTSTQVSENRVASRIDVTNKKLELINRNLLALNHTMETYILPQSAYFSTKTNLADEFALSSKR